MTHENENKSIKVSPPSEQSWRKRIAEEITEGKCVVFCGGRKLTANDVLTDPDIYMMGILDITKEELEAAKGNPQEALIYRMGNNRPQDPYDAGIAMVMQRSMLVPFFKNALGDFWDDEVYEQFWMRSFDQIRWNARKLITKCRLNETIK